MDYKGCLEYLFSAMPSFQNVGGDAYKPGLERIENFCAELGNPHRSYRVIHIAGTNGKGSTSHMLASVLQSAGYRVGLFTSPHLKDFRERMRVDGKMISEVDVVGFVERYRAAMEQYGLSFFEMTAAMAFDHFSREGVDIAVIETGLGGRLDATNIVDPELSIITNIDLDHTQYLGSTKSAIAAEKGGIIKRGRPVVIGDKDVESCDIFINIAADRESSISFAEDIYEVVSSVEYADYQRVGVKSREGGGCETFYLDLIGEYQRRNIITLLAALRHLPDITADHIKSGLKSVMSSTSLRGRWQRISTNPFIVCDTGHNRHGLLEVTRQIAHQQYDQLYCVLGFANDKDVRSIIPLFPSEAHFIFTMAKGQRSLDLDSIRVIAEDLNLDCEFVADIPSALLRARSLATPKDMIYVGGSTFVVAELDLD